MAGAAKLRADAAITRAARSRRERLGPAARRRAHDDERLGYRLTVVASGPVEVVGSAGGWLCDKVLAGWDVTVLLARGGDIGPLQILGVDAVGLEGPLVPARASADRCLAVGADVFVAHPGVRDAVLHSLDCALTEVTLFGGDWPMAVRRRLTAAQHELSGAARMFKGHALASAGIRADPPGPTETFLSDMKPSLRVDSGLVPLS